MKILFASDPPFDGKDKSIFLAGPTPRSKDVLSWRPEAIRILEELKFDGTVLVPERDDWGTKMTYDDQVEWEYAGLSQATIICIWVPRDLQTMPAFTTNVEFGYWLARSTKHVLYGRPDNSPKNRYLDWLYTKTNHVDTPFSSLEELLKKCTMRAEAIMLTYGQRREQ